MREREITHCFCFSLLGFGFGSSRAVCCMAILCTYMYICLSLSWCALSWIIFFLSDLGAKMASRSQIKITYTISRSRSQNQDQFSAEDRDLKITDFEDQVILPIYDTE